MPSPEMRDVISQLRQRKQAWASQPPPPLDQLRAAFAPGGWVHPMPGDVRVTEAQAAGVPAYWPSPPGAAADRVLPHVCPVMLGTPEAAAATEQIAAFLCVRVR